MFSAHVRECLQEMIPCYTEMHYKQPCADGMAAHRIPPMPSDTWPASLPTSLPFFKSSPFSSLCLSVGSHTLATPCSGVIVKLASCSESRPYPRGLLLESFLTILINPSFLKSRKSIHLHNFGFLLTRKDGGEKRK